jgi:endonuclease YncB( thermonuclease family)
VAGYIWVLPSLRLEFNGIPIELDGVRLPEPNEMCGRRTDNSKRTNVEPCAGIVVRQLARLLNGRLFVCGSSVTTADGTAVMTCWPVIVGHSLGPIDTINGQIVEEGWGLSTPSATRNFDPEGGLAHENRTGLWAFGPPNSWQR